MHALTTGLYEVLTYGSISFLSVEEFGELIRGEQEIDIADLKRSTTYTSDGPAVEETTYVEWLWEILESLTDAQKHDFIRFVSGSPMPPMHGFN